MVYIGTFIPKYTIHSELFKTVYPQKHRTFAPAIQ